jgi:hypothetical protein
MSEPIPPPEGDMALNGVILAFINLFPSPTDDQTHALAGLLGFNFQEFEDKVRVILAPILDKDGDDDLDDTIEVIDSADPVDVFLLAFYLLQPEPTEDQLVTLAILLSMTLDELEKRTYDVINKLMEAQPQIDGTTELEDVDLTDEFNADDQDPDEPLTDSSGNVIQLL